MMTHYAASDLGLYCLPKNLIIQSIKVLDSFGIGMGTV